MNSNTISFNPGDIAPGQKLTEKEIAGINYKGRWINIFSKDSSNPVTESDLETIGIKKEAGCLSALPNREYIQCHKTDVDLFSIISKTIEEKFKHTNL